jgi:KUP system potassium uptake protein
LYPMVFLATLAAIIASQALITGVYSLTQQAIQLGYSPRMQIVHTSKEEMGQIYIPQVNWALMILTVIVVIEFRTSSNLADAYGVAVAIAMVVTAVFLSFYAREKWKWAPLSLTLFVGVFLTIDLVFLSANFLKIIHGGWLPLSIAAVVFTLMTTWKRGRVILMARLKEKSIPFEQFIQSVRSQTIARVPGTAIFMTGDPEGTPPALLHNVKHNKVLHERVILLTISTRDVPHITDEEKVVVKHLADSFFRVKAYCGFMETPDIQSILRASCGQGIDFEIKEATFFLGRETLIPSEEPGMSIWREALFAFMSKNAERATTFFNIPVEQVVEVGIQIKI